MKRIARISLAAMLAASFAAGQVAAAESSPQAQGLKIDSGLGDLPHYRHWVDKTGKNPLPHRVVGEKLDSGLGDIKPVSPQRSSIELAQHN